MYIQRLTNCADHVLILLKNWFRPWLNAYRTEPQDGRHQGKERREGLQQNGGKQWKLSVERWVLITWDEAGKMKKDRDGWRELVVALCLTGGDEAE